MEKYKNTNPEFIVDDKIDAEKFIRAIVSFVADTNTIHSCLLSIKDGTGPDSKYVYKDEDFDGFGKLEIPGGWEYYHTPNEASRNFSSVVSVLNATLKDKIAPPSEVITARFIVGKDVDLDTRNDKEYHNQPPQPQPQPEPKSEEPEESKEPPVTIRPDGVPGSYYISPEISGPPAVPAKDPHFVKVIVVDKNTLKVLPTTNHWLPRKDEMSPLANSFFCSEQSYGNLPGYAFAGLISEEEAVNSPALQAIMALYDAEYIILVG